ncbi:hypothetical protein AXF42_Ash000781 [Apostasia shenzhenica]|uniref:Uncharacterized protein n=1 Tax=Apostasia shenzhenica TaxID=1088818 RepID=A0A2I0AHF5_9ASPA|nr:hypothetical protein AXF42_Ash000781 [Apostasia shenzhenica]
MEKYISCRSSIVESEELYPSESVRGGIVALANLSKRSFFLLLVVVPISVKQLMKKRYLVFKMNGHYFPLDGFTWEVACSNFGSNRAESKETFGRHSKMTKGQGLLEGFRDDKKILHLSLSLNPSDDNLTTRQTLSNGQAFLGRTAVYTIVEHRSFFSYPRYSFDSSQQCQSSTPTIPDLSPSSARDVGTCRTFSATIGIGAQSFQGTPGRFHCHLASTSPLAMAPGRAGEPPPHRPV